MAFTSFDEFVQREQQAVKVLDEQPVDWQAQKSEWLRYLDELFAKIVEFLDLYVAQGQVTIEYKPIELNEEYIGPYSAREMIITIGSKVIKLEPIGTNLVGSKGRVDAFGPLARVQLLLMDRNVKSPADIFRFSVTIDGRPLTPPTPKSDPSSKIDWTWKIATRPPNLTFVDIDKDTFLNLLLEVSNG
jgi:hypothetical protein